MFRALVVPRGQILTPHLSPPTPPLLVCRKIFVGGLSFATTDGACVGLAEPGWWWQKTLNWRRSLAPTPTFLGPVYLAPPPLPPNSPVSLR